MKETEMQVFERKILLYSQAVKGKRALKRALEAGRKGGGLTRFRGYAIFYR
jgi:hypothetical protein